MQEVEEVKAGVVVKRVEAVRVAVVVMGAEALA